MAKTRKSYPSDGSNAEWAFCAPDLTLMREVASQQEDPLRELLMGCAGCVGGLSAADDAQRPAALARSPTTDKALEDALYDSQAF
jgi:hypothetical protein